MLDTKIASSAIVLNANEFATLCAGIGGNAIDSGNTDFNGNIFNMLESQITTLAQISSNII